LLQKDTTLLQEPYRNICGKFSDWACLDSEEEVKNVKSL
jgi:hypothetical protein